LGRAAAVRRREEVGLRARALGVRDQRVREHSDGVGWPGQRRPEGATSARRVVLATERLLLEPVGPGHAARIYDVVVASRPELLPWMPWARNPTLESTLAMSQRDERAWQDDRVYQFVLV